MQSLHHFFHGRGLKQLWVISLALASACFNLVYASGAQRNGCGFQAPISQQNFKKINAHASNNDFHSSYVLAAPTIVPKLSFHVQVVRAQRRGENDPANIPTVTPTEVTWAVGQANQVLAQAGVELLFDPVKDFEPNIVVDSFLANDFVMPNSGELSNPENRPPTVDCETFNRARNEYAQRYPGKLVLFFVPGTDLAWDKVAKSWKFSTRRGYGYANWVDNYVAMTLGIGGDFFLAHEVGHYLHLAHTHGPAPETNQQAVEVLQRNNFDLERAFNGDIPYVFDTPADPANALFSANGIDQCGSVNDVPIMVADPDGGVINYFLSPDRTNVMSYFKHCTTFSHSLSNEQIVRVRESLLWGNRQHLLGKEWKGKAPELASWGPLRVDISALGTDTGVRHISRENERWGGWEYLGGQMQAPPTSVSWGGSRLDLFALGIDDQVYHKAMAGSAASYQWYPSQVAWENLGGQFFSPPVVISPYPGRLEIFGQGKDGGVWRKEWNSVVWVPDQLTWENLGGQIIGRPSALMRLQELHLFVQGADRAVWTKSFYSHTWHPSQMGWSSLGGSITSDVAAVSSLDKKKIYLAVRGLDGAVWFKRFDGESWSPAASDWLSLGGAIKGNPTIVSREDDGADIFVRGTDNGLWMKSMTGGGWNPSGQQWQNLGGQLADDPKAVVLSTNQLEVYAIWNDGTYRRREWKNGRWSEWLNMDRYIE